MVSEVSFDERAVTVNGKRTLLVSGSMHYPRSTPAMWPDLMKRARAAGLNCLDTYVFWNLHEKRKGQFDFSDRLDLVRWLQTAQSYGMHVILRLGPYICAETNYGGFPAWLRDEPGIEMRTHNGPFMREMERWMRLLCQYIKPFFASNGGPIILAQVENEYALISGRNGAAGQEYLSWCMDLAQSLDVGIPWIMCEGGAEGALVTINSFFAHEQIDNHAAKNPGQPALWTENWSAWYTTFGTPYHRRDPRQIAYAVARFIAAGGTGANYFMWHGGTNFGRDAMNLQTTSYDFDAPLDEYGLPTVKYEYLKALHRVLHDCEAMLLTNDRALPRSLGDKQVAFDYGTQRDRLTFLCNDDAEKTARVDFLGRAMDLKPHSVVIMRGDRQIYDSSRELAAAENTGSGQMLPVKGVHIAYDAWQEPLHDKRPVSVDTRTQNPAPLEQLLLTRDESDYCWYTATVKVTPRQARANGSLVFTACADMLYVFIDGKHVATTPSPIGESSQADSGFRQEFAIKLLPGTHNLAVLSCALGLVKGDWILNANMVQEKKGIWGAVELNGKPVGGPWNMHPFLAGEKLHAFGTPGTLLPWKQVKGTSIGARTWLRATFKRPTGDEPLAVDLRGLTKGIAWLNGQCIGRYWLVEAEKERFTALYPTVESTGVGEPTQRYYHLPREWISEKNTLVMFEEQGGSVGQVKICYRK